MFKGRPAALDALVMVADHQDTLLSSVVSSHMKVAKKMPVSDSFFIRVSADLVC